MMIETSCVIGGQFMIWTKVNRRNESKSYRLSHLPGGSVSEGANVLCNAHIRKHPCMQP